MNTPSPIAAAPCTCPSSSPSKQAEQLAAEIISNGNAHLAAHAIEGYKDAATRELRQALEMLRDHQNGPPLPSWEAGWNDAMKMADAALERTAPR